MISTLLRTLLLATFVLLAHHPLSTVSQTFIPSSLPTCAATCAQLQNAQTGCTPAGGAPVSNQQTYQSCFCQSALLTAYLQSPGVQLCTQCAPADNQAIQNWYQGFCKGGGNAPQSTGTAASQPASTNAPIKATSSISQVQNNPAETSGATVVGNSQGVTDSDATQNGPWCVLHVLP